MKQTSFLISDCQYICGSVVVNGNIVVNYEKNLFRLIYELEYYHNVKQVHVVHFVQLQIFTILVQSCDIWFNIRLKRWSLLSFIYVIYDYLHTWWCPSYQMMLVSFTNNSTTRDTSGIRVVESFVFVQWFIDHIFVFFPLFFWSLYCLLYWPLCTLQFSILSYNR
jgi:hypothetical protein